MHNHVCNITPSVSNLTTYLFLEGVQ